MSIEVRELHQHYGATRAMDGVCLTLPDDVQVLSESVLAHRLMLNTKARYDGTNKNAIIQSIVDSVPVPI